jgi:hypothetical protein
MIKGFLSLVAIYFLATVAAIIGVTAAVSTMWGIFVAGENTINWFSRRFGQRTILKSDLSPAA